MIKIALAGEDPNDSNAIRNLLLPIFGSVAQFKIICRNLRGGQLDSPKYLKQVSSDTKNGDFNLLICIRDLDAFKTETEKLRKRQEWFENVKNAAHKCESIFLLNIWEIEALLLSDQDLINKKYGTTINFTKDPIFLKEPKEYLKLATRNSRRKYVESDCQDLFTQIDYEKVKSRCEIFKDFIEKFKSMHKLMAKIG
jgi:hypothetical protein